MKKYTLSLAIMTIALIGCADDSDDAEISEEDVEDTTEEEESDDDAVSEDTSGLVMGVLATPNSLDHMQLTIHRPIM